VINDIDGWKITRLTKPINDKPGLKFLSIRLANIRKRQVCTAQIRLLMLKKGTRINPDSKNITLIWLFQ